MLGHGTAAAPPSLQPIPSSGPDLGAALEALAQDIARSAPAGLSAGREQPKVLVVNDRGEHFIAKFSPPRGTAFSDRWHNLLHAESLCMEVLARHGHDVSRCQLVEGASRTFLLSHRFDRAGRLGRRHVVAIGAVCAAFVAGAYNHWASTADALVRQGRLPLADAQRVHFRLQFGRLTGNSDMHSGNLSLFAQGSDLAAVAKGQFTLAPVYDMLPMRWRPDPMVGAMDYSPFAPDDRLADAAVRLAAHDFWTTLAKHPSVSVALKDVATEMALRMGCAAA